MGNSKILAVIWKEHVDSAIVDSAVIGIVAYNTGKGKWKASMGITRLGWAVKEGTKQELREAAQTITDIGEALTAEQAHGFFPELDISEYIS